MLRTFSSLAALITLLSAACHQERDIRGYYFPVRKLTTGLIYEYANTGTLNDAEFEYWYYLGVDLDTALYLSATRYADGLTPDQVARERITNEGVLLEELTLLPLDTAGQRQPIETDILFDRVFPFYLAGQPAGYRVRFQGGGAAGNPGATTYVTLNRRYRSDTVVNILGEEYSAIVFDLEGEVSERDAELGDISPTFLGYEIYARGLGLVEYQRDLGAGGVSGGKLTQRLGMQEYLR